MSYQRNLFDQQMDLIDQLHEQKSPLFAEAVKSGDPNPVTTNTTKQMNANTISHVGRYGTTYPAAYGWRRLDFNGAYRLDKYVPHDGGREVAEGTHAASFADMSAPYSNERAGQAWLAGAYPKRELIRRGCDWCYLNAPHTMEAHIQSITELR